VTTYLLAGCVVWLVDPVAETLTIYITGKTPQTLSKNDTLYGGDVLAGFELALSKVFRD
jgi:Uma2 family endonuclease